MEEQASRFIVFFRWIVFLPIGFVLGTVASAILLRTLLFCAILFGSHLSEIAASFWWRAFWLPLTNGVYGVAWVSVSTSLAPSHKIGAAYVAAVLCSALPIWSIISSLIGGRYSYDLYWDGCVIAGACGMAVYIAKKGPPSLMA